MISIAALIYRSTKYADAVAASLYRHTPMLQNGAAEFYFVANDASDGVIAHLEKSKYKFYINNNPIRSESELFEMGIGCPEYIHRVYRGWNEAIKRATGDIVVLVNSDNMFSPNWLENLLKHLSPSAIVCSQLIERIHPKYGVFPGAYVGNFGSHPSNFKEENFLTFCRKNRKSGTREGGAYMPCMLYKYHAESVGYYPEGNIAGNTFNNVKEYGDECFFRKLKDIGVNHVTALDSLCYHFKEGEMEE